MSLEGEVMSSMVASSPSAFVVASKALFLALYTVSPPSTLYLIRMVFYECLLTAKNTAHFDSLSRLVKNVSLKVVENGGVVRSIRNHGIRDLPHKFRSRFPDTLGNRYYRKGRFFSIYYDASPQTMRQVESIISMDDIVLRQTHLKTRSKLDYVNIQNEDKNPYIRKVLQQEQQESSSGGLSSSSIVEEISVESSQSEALNGGEKVDAEQGRN